MQIFYLYNDECGNLVLKQTFLYLFLLVYKLILKRIHIFICGNVYCKCGNVTISCNGKTKIQYSKLNSESCIDKNKYYCKNWQFKEFLFDMAIWLVTATMYNNT